MTACIVETTSLKLDNLKLEIAAAVTVAPGRQAVRRSVVHRRTATVRLTQIMIVRRRPSRRMLSGTGISSNIAAVIGRRKMTYDSDSTDTLVTPPGLRLGAAGDSPWHRDRARGTVTGSLIQTQGGGPPSVRPAHCNCKTISCQKLSLTVQPEIEAKLFQPPKTSSNIMYKLFLAILPTKA